MAGIRFNLSQRGLNDVMRSKGVQGYLKAAAKVTEEAVEAQASQFAHTRHFAKSITSTDVDVTPRGARVTVFSTDPSAHIIEDGSINNPPYAPFRKAATTLGLHLRGGGNRP